MLCLCSADYTLQLKICVWHGLSVSHDCKHRMCLVHHWRHISDYSGWNIGGFKDVYWMNAWSKCMCSYLCVCPFQSSLQEKARDTTGRIKSLVISHVQRTHKESRSMLELSLNCPAGLGELRHVQVWCEFWNHIQTLENLPLLLAGCVCWLYWWEWAWA